MRLNLNGKRLILGSASPRRATLLRMIGFEFDVIESRLNEAEESYTVPEVHVLEIAQKKALKVAETIDNGLVIAADTIVILKNQILGKPANTTEARKTLQLLSGNTHTVCTGFAILDKPSCKLVSEYEKTEVKFRNLNEEEIETYIQSGSPLDKAGAYGIQDQGAIFVDKINGCFYNVMGLPLARMYTVLLKFIADGEDLKN